MTPSGATDPDAAAPAVAGDLAALRAAFLREEKPSAGGGILLVILMLVVLTQLAGEDPFSPAGLRWLLISSAVIAFHEAGHWAAMRAFGFRDLRVYILPLVGGLASGVKRGAPAWQHAIVSLAGPLPGIALGVGAAVLAGVTSSGAVAEVALVLVGINALNLLPVPPLDGGRLLQDLVGSRSRALAIAGPWMAAAAAVALALALRSLLLGFLALGQLASARHRSRLAREVFALRGAGIVPPSEPSEVGDLELLEMARAASSLSPPGQELATLRALHDQASRSPPGVLATLGLLALWGGGFLLALVALVIAAPGPGGG